MEASERLIDIFYYLGVCLTTGEEMPAAWRPLAEALLRVSRVRGVLVALWGEAQAPLLLALGELPGDGAEMANVGRAAHWEHRADGAPVAATLPLDAPVVAAPLGSARQPVGIIALAVEEPHALLLRLAEAVAAGLTVALQRRQLAGEIRRLEDSVQHQMVRLDELAAVGQLAASVAHELRNPLSSIKGAAQYLRNEYQEHTTIREFLDIILEEVGVLSRITSEFLDFARPMHLNLQEAHLHDSIRRLLQVMKPQLAAQRIEAVVELGEDVPPTVFDAQQIDHALRNIVLNAIQAMPDGGTIAVRTRYLAVPLPGVEIAVSDTGPGISLDAMGKLFTPFFTTKTKGVGLGLTIVQKIVQNHGGTVSVESQPGSGSTFHIHLPCSPGAENARAN